MDKENRDYTLLNELYDREPIGQIPEELPEHEGTLRVFRDLTYNSGYGYMLGLIQKEATKSWKLARTSILNFGGRRMAAFSNIGGTIGTIFTFNEALFRYLMIENKDRPIPWVTHPWAFDSRNTAGIAGFMTGLLYKITAKNIGVTLGCAVAGGAIAHLNSRRYTPQTYFDLYKQYLPADPMMM